MKKILFLSMAFLSLFFFFSCKKHTAKPLIKLEQQTKDYTVFLENSYSVYQREGQNTKDTCKLSKSILVSVLSNSLDYEPEFQEMTLYSTYYKMLFYLNSDTESNTDKLNIQRIWFDGARTPTKCVFFSNRSVGDAYNYWYYPDNIVTYQSYLPTYVLDGKTYNEVMVFESRYTGALSITHIFLDAIWVESEVCFSD